MYEQMNIFDYLDDTQREVKEWDIHYKNFKKNKHYH